MFAFPLSRWLSVWTEQRMCCLYLSKKKNVLYAIKNVRRIQLFVFRMPNARSENFVPKHTMSIWELKTKHFEKFKKQYLFMSISIRARTSTIHSEISSSISLHLFSWKIINHTIRLKFDVHNVKSRADKHMNRLLNYSIIRTETKALVMKPSIVMLSRFRITFTYLWHFFWIFRYLNVIQF